MTDDTPQTAATEAVNKAVHGFVSQILADEDASGVADCLVAYGLSLLVQIHDRQAVARHLYALSLRFADERQPIPGEAGSPLN